MRITLRLIAGLCTLLAAVHTSLAQPTSAPAVTGSAAPRGLPDFADLAEQVGPSVVNIRTTEKVVPGQAGSQEEQMLEFFRRFGLPVLEAMAAKILHVGPSGAGNVAKLVNNMLVASHMITTLEAVKLAQAAGVSAEDALRVVNSATGRSAISEIHFPNWVLPRSFNSGFTTGLMRKDVRLALELAAATGCDMPLSTRVAELWAEPQSGLKDADDFMLMGDPQADRTTLKDVTND